jgi:hypothetical protein
MDVPTSLPGADPVRTNRDAIAKMELRLTWLESITLLIEKESQDILPSPINDALASRMTFLAYALRQEYDAIQAQWLRAWEASKAMVPGEECADA